MMLLVNYDWSYRNKACNCVIAVLQEGDNGAPIGELQSWAAVIQLPTKFGNGAGTKSTAERWSDPNERCQRRVPRTSRLLLAPWVHWYRIRLNQIAINQPETTIIPVLLIFIDFSLTDFSFLLLTSLIGPFQPHTKKNYVKTTWFMKSLLVLNFNYYHTEHFLLFCWHVWLSQLNPQHELLFVCLS